MSYGCLPQPPLPGHTVPPAQAHHPQAGPGHHQYTLRPSLLTPVSSPQEKEPVLFRGSTFPHLSPTPFLEFFKGLEGD